MSVFIRIAVALLVSVATLWAERNDLKPEDFVPLTSLPWKKPDATLDGTLAAIFLEPDAGIRYPVLADYLRTMPTEQLGKAFDICITLEGTQTPDALVEFFLQLWAERDPKRCWERTKLLFRVVGIEEGWLGYDSWKTRPRITVQDAKAIQNSPFWLESSSLRSFPIGVDRSSLSDTERVQIMKDFADLWFATFQSWPGYQEFKRSDHDSRSLGNIFDQSTESLRSYVDQSHYNSDEAKVAIALRRLLKADPAAAPEIFKIREQIKWTPDALAPWVYHSSIELLMIWAKADLSAMTQWVETLDRKDPMAIEAKGLLMSRVDGPTRKRWLANAKSEKLEDDLTEELLSGWAGWDPKAALAEAVATKNIDTIFDVAIDAAYGPFGGQTVNASHLGLGVIKDFDLGSLPKETRNAGFHEGWEMIMEQWGDVDIGEAARYGFGFLLKTAYARRDRLIKVFGGDDIYGGEDGMIDRTFCCLRVWAIVRPEEMKTWIATLPDAEMREALTWLSQNPWGSPEDDGK